MVWAQVLTTYYVLIIYRYDEEKQSSTCIQIVKLTIIPERGHNRSGCNFVKWCWKKREENEYLLCEIDVEAINSTWKFFLFIHFILLHSLEVCVCVCSYYISWYIYFHDMFPWWKTTMKLLFCLWIVKMMCTLWYFFQPNQEMKTKSLTFNENRQIFVTDSNKNVVSLLSIKFWDLLKIIHAVGKFYENLERVFSYEV